MRQFSLLSLIMSTVLLALSLAAFGVWGILVGPILLVIVGRLRRLRSRQEAFGVWGVLAGSVLSAPVNRLRRRYEAFGVWGVLAGLITWIFAVLLRRPLSRREVFGIVLFQFSLCVLVLTQVETVTSRERPRLDSCRINLTRIKAALLSYESRHGEFPSIRESDRLGKPPCSWRYSILPYLDEVDLLKGYNRGEPWDSPNNSALTCFEYCCPNGLNPGWGKTSYLAIVRADGKWLSPIPTKKTDPVNPALVIEMRGMSVGFFEPRDVSLEDICKADKKALESHEGASRGVFLLSPTGGNPCCVR